LDHVEYLLSGGRKLAYAHRPGRLPGVLFCTGFNSDMGGDKAMAIAAWCRSQGRQFTRFDYSGHGASSGNFEDGTLGDWLEDALAIFDRVTSGQQIIVGSSMGAWVMLLLAVARSQRVNSLLAIAPAPDFTRYMLRERLSAAQVAQLAEDGYCQIDNQYDDGQPYRIRRRLLEEAEQHEMLDTVIGIDCPVRIIHGQRDQDIPWQRSLQLVEALRSDDVELQLVKQGDHRLSTAVDIQRMLATLEQLVGQVGADEGS
jgi:pimeloyl-ACP methyl ester carboxylesterase